MIQNQYFNSDNKLNRKKNLKNFYMVIGMLFFFIMFIAYLVLPRVNTTSPGDIELLSIDPQPPTIKSPWSTEPITFIFDQPINVETVKYTVSPPIETKVTQTGRLNEFSIVPLTGWDDGREYTINISEDLQSLSGGKLKDSIEISFTRETDFSQYPQEHGERYDF